MTKIKGIAIKENLVDNAKENAGFIDRKTSYSKVEFMAKPVEIDWIRKSVKYVGYILSLRLNDKPSTLGITADDYIIALKQMGFTKEQIVSGNYEFEGSYKLTNGKLKKVA